MKSLLSFAKPKGQRTRNLHYGNIEGCVLILCVKKLKIKINKTLYYFIGYPIM